MKFLITVPDVPYYIWQMLVQINNFRRMGYEQDTIYLIGIRNPVPSKELVTLINSGEFNCSFVLIKDDRQDNSYTVSLKPFLVKNFLKENPEMVNETFLYTDPDVIFTKSIDFSKFENDDVWYLSDTRSYIDSKYIKSKGEQLFIEMCGIVGIDPKLVEDNDDNAGGACWIIKNNTYDLWDEIQFLCPRLYRHLITTAKKYHPEGQDYPIQAWTTEMWLNNWVPLKYGYQLKIDKELDFCMASDTKERLDQVKIFHNASVAAENGKDFCKITHQYSPFNKKIFVSEESASYPYYLEILDTEKNFKELIF